MTAPTQPGSARLVLATLAAALLLTIGAACSEDDKNEARDTATSLGEEIGDRANQTAARTQAEALRALIKEDDRTPAEGARSVAVLQESVGELPGDPDVVGIEDGDGDGLDDDGRVEVRANAEAACLTLPETGDEIEVEGGACS